MVANPLADGDGSNNGSNFNDVVVVPRLGYVLGADFQNDDVEERAEAGMVNWGFRAIGLGGSQGRGVSEERA